MSQIKRSSNFSTKEIEYLIQLVEKNKATIECKKTDRTCSEEKINCWMQIEAEFNSAFDIYRSHKTLKTKYENLKKSAKQNYAKDKEELYRTGGGVKSTSKVTTVDEGILKIVQEEQIAGNVSMYDDDFLTEEKLDEEYLLDEPPMDCILIEEQPATSKWDKYSPMQLKTQKHNVLNTDRKRTSRDAWANVAELKMKKLKLEMLVIKEEWNLKKTKLELEVEELKRNAKTKKEE